MKEFIKKVGNSFLILGSIVVVLAPLVLVSGGVIHPAWLWLYVIIFPAIVTLLQY